jgi:hypothetical protein
MVLRAWMKREQWFVWIVLATLLTLVLAALGYLVCPSVELGLRNPTTGIAACCARAATGQAAAAPPSNVMNSRRLMSAVLVR